MNEKKAIQDFYSEQMSQCYGCGRLNDSGLKLKSFWNEDEDTSTATFKPKSYYISFPGFVNGGLIASLIDCHGTGTAAAAAYKAEGRKMGTEPELRYVTASLHVDFIKPTPIDQELVLIAKVKEVKGRKVIVKVDLFVDDILCAQGEVIAVKIPDTMIFN
ncbi:MAG: PaaI family thioesterase [Candidatus Hermodarchaeota archaeon]